MKKISMLISALALAACGGGGSNVTGGSAYVPPRAAVTAAVATSNAQITGLPSEVVVASNSSDPVSVVGAISTESGGVTYTSYRLDDVKLLTAENLDPAGHSYVNLELNQDTGEIDAVKMMVGGEGSGRNVRDGDVFQGPIFEYVSNDPEDDQALFRVVDNGQNMAALNALATQNNLSGGHWNRIDERMVFSSHGRDIGLRYTDFGYFNPVYKSKNVNLTSDDDITKSRLGTRTSGENKYRDDAQFTAALNKEDYQLFAGGYAIDGTNMVDTLTPENGATYTGKAIGRVYASIQSSGANRADYLSGWNVPYDQAGNTYSDDAGHGMAKAYTTSLATMEIGMDGSQTLSLPFNTHSDTADKFYDVTIVKTTPDADPAFTFEAPEALNELQYRRNTTEGNLKKDFTPGYYGVNTAAEAAGTAFYRSKQVDADGSREWEFQAAYGMKKD